MKQFFLLLFVAMSFTSYSNSAQGWFGSTGVIYGNGEVTEHDPFYFVKKLRKKFWLTDNIDAMEAFCQARANGSYLRHEIYTTGYLINMIAGKPELKESPNIVSYITCSDGRS